MAMTMIFPFSSPPHPLTSPAMEVHGSPLGERPYGVIIHWTKEGSLASARCYVE
jgi:hypothetical protein